MIYCLAIEHRECQGRLQELIVCSHHLTLTNTPDASQELSAINFGNCISHRELQEHGPEDFYQAVVCHHL